MKRPVLSLLVLLAWLPCVRAAAPNYVPVQGILTDSQGNAVDGEVQVQFAIYTEETGGSPIWSETQTVAVGDGLFLAYLGVESALDLSVFKDNGNLWLGIQLDGDTEMNRAYLGSTPFSAYAEYCGQVPQHGHAPSDLTLPDNLALGPQGCVGTDKVVGLDASGALLCDSDQLGSGGEAYLAGFGLDLSNSTFSVDTGEIQARVTGECAAGNCIRQVQQSGAVTCEPTGSGGTYQAGFGLDLNVDTFEVDPTEIQARVTGDCAPSGAVQTINQDGSVACIGEGTNPALLFDSGWTAYPFGHKTYIDHGIASSDFVFGMVRGWSDLAGQVTMPAMSAVAVNYVPAYVEKTATAVGLNGSNYITAINNLGDENNVLIRRGEISIRVFDRAADYDSGWQACAAGNTYLLTHSLGSLPHFVLLEVAQNSDGSGWRVPTMTSSYYDGAGWRQTALVALSDSQATIRTHGNLAYFRDVNGTNQAPTSGYYRLRLYLWEPDYDSGWVSMSTTAGDRDRRFRHDFGSPPSLIALYVAQNSDGSGWFLPAMGNYHRGYNYGVGLYSLDNRWAVVKGGAAYLAQYVDGGGSGQAPTTGYVRLVAWR